MTQLRWQDLHSIVVFVLSDAIFRYDLDIHALEVDR